MACLKKIACLLLMLVSFALQANNQPAIEDMAMHAYRSGDYRTAYHQLFLAKQSYSSSGEAASASRCWLYMCGSLFFQGQYMRCHQELDMVEKNMTKHLPANHILWAKFYQVKGALLSDEASYEEAIDLLKKAADLYQNAGGKYLADAVNVFNLIGNIYLETSAFGSALKTYKKALRILYHTPQKDLDSNALANTYGNIGATFQYLEQYDSAAYYHLLSRKLYTIHLGPSNPKVANQLYNLALVSLETGYYDEAISGFQQALSIYEEQEFPYHPELSEIYGSLGAVYAIKGEWEAAFNSYYQDSLHTTRTFGPDHPYMALCYQEMAATRLQMGNPIEAIRLLEKANQIFLKKYEIHSNLVRNHLLLGKALYVTGAYPAGIRSLRTAYLMEKTLINKENSRTAEILLYEGLCRIKLGKLAAAEENIRRSLTISAGQYRSMGALTCDVHLAMADIYTQKNNTTGALHEMQLALQATHSKKMVLFPQQYIQCCLAIARHYEQAGRLSSALQYLDSAQAVSNQRRSEFVFETSAFDWAAKVRSISDMGIDICFRLYNSTKKDPLYYLEKAYIYTEYNKAFQLRQHTAKMQRNKLSGMSKEAVETEVKLRAEMAYYHALLEAYTSGESKQGKSLLGIQEKLFNLSNEYERFVKRVKQHHPEYYAMAYDNNMPGIKTITQKLPRKKCLLIFHADDRFLYLIALNKGEEPVFKQIPVSEITGTSEILQEAILANNFRVFRSAAYRLYSSLLKDLPETFHKKGLVVIADGPLHRVPFETLLTMNADTLSPKEYPYLIRRQSVIYSPSATLYFTQHNHWRNKKASVTAFAPSLNSTNLHQFGEINTI